MNTGKMNKIGKDEWAERYITDSKKELKNS